MAHASLEKQRIQSIPDNEPLFVIRAQDCLSGRIVRVRADQAEQLGVTSRKVREARRIADDMDKWQPKKLPD